MPNSYGEKNIACLGLNFDNTNFNPYTSRYLPAPNVYSKTEKAPCLNVVREDSVTNLLQTLGVV